MSPWDGSRSRRRPLFSWPTDYVDVPIPDGLCGVFGCVFLYGHRGLHSWAPKPKGRQS